MYINQVTLVGTVSNEPNFYSMETTQKVSFRVHTQQEFVKNDGSTAEINYNHNVVVWGRNCEKLKDGFGEGCKVAVNGSITYRSYETQDGEKKYITEINANSVEFERVEAEEPPPIDHVNDDEDDDDIPF